MTYEELTSLFCPPGKESFLELLKENDNEKHVNINGLAGSSLSLLAAPLVTSFKHHHLFILPDRESAAFLYHDLEKILGDHGKDLVDKRVHYFPSSYRRTHKVDETDNANIKLRSEILNKLVTRDEKYVIVSYPDALSERLASTRYLRTNSFNIKLGEILPIDIFLEFLYNYQYQQEDFVFEPGQFAWRGGIFDIYSYSEEYPYRIELTGDKITSIRLFDTNTQLSVKEVNQLHVMPLSSASTTVEEKVSFFEFLSQDSIFWIKDIADVKTQLDVIFAKVEKENSESDSTIEHLPTEQIFIQGKDFLEGIVGHTVIEFNAKTLDHYDLSLNFNIKQQNNFGKNFDFLLEEWISNVEHGYQNIFLSENAQQHQRIKEIMSDLLSKYNRQHIGEFTIEQLYTPSECLLHEGFSDFDGKLCVYTDHQFFEKYHRFAIRDRYKKSEAFTLKEIYDLQPGDYVVHIDHGIGIYQGLEKVDVNGKEMEAIKLAYKDGDILYISIHSLHKITKYVGKEGTAPTLHRIGSGTWERVKERTKRRVKELTIDLIKLYAERKSKKGFSYSPDNYLQKELEASFIYEDTPDQLKSSNEVKADMESANPMDRLICGDVGFGKTEIAIRAAFKAVCDSKQVAVLVPTTVLALQHFNTFQERLINMPCSIDYVNRFKTAKQIKESLLKLKEGKTDILIGTHRLLSKDVEFKDLGLLIIDEEQKFGVAAKEKLRELKVNVDTLTMSATPIPRTLQFSLMGARDISVITTPPPNRYPIQTEIHVFNEEIIRDAVSYEMSRGGQTFIVHNKVQNIQEVAGMVQRLVPDARIAIGHGQMDGEELEKIMMGFIHGDYDVLVATTIVESGLDITNANTIIINDAQNYALNVLHQLRGRVGRNNKKAFCYLLIRSWEDINETAKKRLKAIEDYADIGSGFQIAMRDLDIRGAGDILGGEQSGFISEIGFEMYQKILNEAIMELRDSSPIDLPMADNSALLRRECLLETDLSVLLPTEYVASVSERMSLYKELSNLKKEEELQKFASKLIDMFGPLPNETQELLQTMPLRWKAADLYFEKIVLKKGTFTGYFIGNCNSPFYQSELFSKILLFMQKNHPTVQIKEVNQKLILTIKNIPTIKSAIHWLEKIEKM